MMFVRSILVWGRSPASFLKSVGKCFQAHARAPGRQWKVPLPAALASFNGSVFRDLPILLFALRQATYSKYMGYVLFR